MRIDTIVFNQKYELSNYDTSETDIQDICLQLILHQVNIFIKMHNIKSNNIIEYHTQWDFNSEYTKVWYKVIMSYYIE